MADMQRSLTGQTIGGARETLETVAGSGLFGPQAFAQVSRAVGDYQRLTHSNAEDAAKVFDGLADDATAWAEKTNRAYHFLTLAQYDQIKALQDAGDKQGAAALAAKDLAETLESRGTPAAGAFARAWNAVTGAVSGAVDAIKNVGRPQDALTAALEAVDRQTQLVKNANSFNPAGAADYLNALSAERQRIMQQQFRESERASAASLAAQQAQAGIEAQKYTEQILKSAKALSARNEELDKFHKAVEAQAAAGKPLSALDIKAGEAEINKRYTDHSQDAQESAYSRLNEMVKAFNQTTQQEIERQGKLTEAQTFAIHAHEELEKAKKKLTAAQYASLSVSINEAAAQRQAAQFSLDATKAVIESVRASTANQEAQRSIVTGLVQAGNDQANAIYRQMALIGKNADDALKIKELQQFDDLVGKALLGADNQTTQEILRVAAVIRGNLAGAIDEAKKAQDDFNASFENGWNKAARDYSKQAADNAGAAEKVFQDAARGMGDAIVQFAMTGKLSFKSFVDSVISDLLRIEVRKGIAALFGSGGGSVPGTSGSSNAAGLIGAAGSALANSNVIGNLFDIFPALANGLDYVPYDGYPAILHEGEKVTRRQDAAIERGSMGTHVHLGGLTVHAYEGVSRSEVYAAAKQAQQSAVAEVMRYARTGKVVGA
jgi:lambda family phage tail tape measure protein